MDEQKTPRFKLASHLSNVDKYFNKDNPPIQHHLYFYDLNLSGRNSKQGFKTLSQEILKLSAYGRNICVINDRLEDHYSIVTNGLNSFDFPEYEINELEIQTLDSIQQPEVSIRDTKQSDKIVAGKLVHTKLTVNLRNIINELTTQKETITNRNRIKIEKVLLKVKNSYKHLNLSEFLDKFIRKLNYINLQEIVEGLMEIESFMNSKPLFTNLLFITTSQSCSESIKTIWNIKPVTVIINRNGSIRDRLGSIGAVQTLDTGHITYIFGYYLLKPISNICLVELSAILLAISKVRKSKSDHLFCTDSLSAIDIIARILTDQEGSNLVKAYPIIKQLINQLQLGNNFRIKYVKGHSDNLGNQLADKLATYAHTMGKPLDVEEWLNKALAKF